MPTDPKLPTPSALSPGDNVTPGESSQLLFSYRKAPPEVTLPEVSIGFVPVRLRRLRTFRMNLAEYTAMPKVAKDCADGAALAKALGPSAPPLAPIAEQIETALAWRALRDKVERFLAYVKAGDAAAWNQAWGSIGEVKPFYMAALPHNATIRLAAPGLTALYEAQSTTATRAAVTRKKKARAAAGLPT
jgi:hypothetical protein